MAGETSSRPTIAGFEISTRATPGISASIKIKGINIAAQKTQQLAVNAYICWF
jgi:hypothetical protein